MVDGAWLAGYLLGGGGFGEGGDLSGSVVGKKKKYIKLILLTILWVL